MSIRNLFLLVYLCNIQLKVEKEMVQNSYENIKFLKSCNFYFVKKEYLARQVWITENVSILLSIFNLRISVFHFVFFLLCFLFIWTELSLFNFYGHVTMEAEEREKWGYNEINCRHTQTHTHTKK